MKEYANDLNVINDVIAENISPIIGRLFTRSSIDVHDVSKAEMLLVVFPEEMDYRWLKMIAGARRDKLDDLDLINVIRREFCLEMLGRISEDK